jgi:hypothetical protein
MTLFTLSLSAGRGLTTPPPAARVLRDVDEPDWPPPHALAIEPLSELSGSM